MTSVAARGENGRSDPNLEFRLLGPLEVRVNGKPLRLSTRGKHCLVLIILLIKTGQVVPVESLIEYLWATDRPKWARSTVQTCVCRIRRTLGRYGFQITTHGDGYQVSTNGHRVDIEEFSVLANRAFLTPNLAKRVQLLDRALAIWRGPALGDAADSDLRQRLAGGLVELAFTCLEARAEAQLALRQHSVVINELSEVVHRHPTREALVTNLMTALYRAGRQAEALRLYDVTRRALLDGPGVEPGRQLWELYRRILRVEHPSEQLRPAAYEVCVRDERLPWMVGGHPALEFCNTFAGWGRESLPGREWLVSFRALVVWTSYVKLVEDHAVDRLLKLSQTDPGQAGDLLHETRQLRASAYACFTDPGDQSAFERVAQYAEAAAKMSVFVRGSDRRGRWQADDASAGLRLPLHVIAWATADLLDDHRQLTIRTCANPACGWLFLDDSGIGRWCNSGTCGSSDIASRKAR